MVTRSAINLTLGLLMVTASMATAEESVKPESIQMVVIREEESVVASFLGFGAEWDPKFWTMGTFKLDEDFKGEVTVTEADWDLVVKRIRWMRLPFVRMMICIRWLSGGDGKFDWTNKHMQSLYRHLDVCQKEKIGVILTDWGCEPAWLKVPGIADVADPKYAETIGTYLDYLINTKGYTCIQYFVMVNEPENEVRDWNRWKKGVQNVTRVLGERKLQEKICFLGSDESGADVWHRNAADQLPGNWAGMTFTGTRRSRKSAAAACTDTSRPCGTMRWRKTRRPSPSP